MAESKGELKSLLMKVKEENEKADLKPNIQKTKIMTSSPIISWGENGSSDRAYFLQLQNHCGQWLQPWNEKTLAPWKKNYNKPRHCITMQRHHFANKSLYSQSYDSHVWMSELDHKESWALKNLCFWIVMLEKTLVSPLDSKEIKPVSPKGNQPWIFTGRTDAEVETPILWPPVVKSRLSGKDPDAGKDWGQEEKAATEDGTRLNGHEFEQTQGDGEGQGSLACCSSWITKSWIWLSD